MMPVPYFVKQPCLLMLSLRSLPSVLAVCKLWRVSPLAAASTVVHSPSSPLACITLHCIALHRTARPCPALPCSVMVGHPDIVHGGAAAFAFDETFGILFGELSSYSCRVLMHSPCTCGTSSSSGMTFEVGVASQLYSCPFLLYCVAITVVLLPVVLGSESQVLDIGLLFLPTPPLSAHARVLLSALFTCSFSITQLGSWLHSKPDDQLPSGMGDARFPQFLPIDAALTGRHAHCCAVKMATVSCVVEADLFLVPPLCRCSRCVRPQQPACVHPWTGGTAER